MKREKNEKTKSDIQFPVASLFVFRKFETFAEYPEDDKKMMTSMRDNREVIFIYR